MNGYGYHYPAVSQREIKRELYLTSVGRLAHRAGETYPSGGHPEDYQFTWRKGRILGDHTVLWIEEGAGFVETAALGRQELRAGTSLYLPPGVWHRYRPHVQTGWVERWLCLNGRYLHRLSRDGVFPTAPVVRPVSDFKVVDVLFARLCDDAMGGGWQAGALALSLAALLINEPKSRSEAAPPERSRPTDPLIDTLVEYIWSNCHRALNVDGLAKRFGLSRRALERHFAKAWNQSVAREISKARVDRGRSLLAQPGMTVKEASYAAGFGSPRRFIEAHRRLVGTTPGRIRRSRG